MAQHAFGEVLKSPQHGLEHVLLLSYIEITSRAAHKFRTVNEGCRGLGGCYAASHRS